MGDSNMFDTERLRREERKALEMLVSTWHTRHSRTEIRYLEQIITGKTYFTINTFKTSMLPKGQGWVWNQSRSRNTIERFGYQIDFYKVNARGQILSVQCGTLIQSVDISH